MNRFCARLLFAVIFLISTESNGQTMFNSENLFFPLDMENVHVSAFYQTHNPAFLDQDADEEVLKIRSDFDHAGGDFKPFIVPGKLIFMQQSASGKKILDGSQIFKGSFAFQKQIRRGWDWIFTKDLIFGMPFLIGDSTSGNTQFNGIAMQATYSRQLSQKFSAGFELDYYVDEGLKEISPKPTSKHRSISFRTGLRYAANDAVSIGIVLNIKDNNEEISYRQDEGSLYNETILFKFRGYDLPLRFNKKVETRFSYFDDYNTAMSLDWRVNRNHSLIVHGASGIQQMEIKDNATQPQNEGYWKNNIHSVGVRSLSTYYQRLYLLTNYRFSTQNMWARQPIYNVLISEVQKPEHQLSLGVKYLINSRCRANMAINFIRSEIDYSDYYSDIKWDVERNSYCTKFGAGIDWNSSFNTDLAYIYGHSDASYAPPSMSFLSSASQNRSPDIYFYLTNYESHHLKIIFDIRTRSRGAYRLHSEFRHFQPQNSFLFKNKSWNEIRFSLELSLDVY